MGLATGEPALGSAKFLGRTAPEGSPIFYLWDNEFAFPFWAREVLNRSVSNKHEVAEKPAAAPDKTPAKAVAAAAGVATAVRAPHTPTVPHKREYPTLGYE